jgi:hypothetical protein
LVADAYRQALEHFRQHQSQIEAHMWQTFQQSEMPYAHFVNANMHMARNIVAALTLGDMNYIGAEITWIEQLLANYQWPSGTLARYLLAYRDATGLYTNGPGRPIMDWLAQITEQYPISIKEDT